MLLFFYYNFFTLVVTSIILLPIVLFSTKFCIQTVILDLFARSLSNDFFLTNMFFFWTNLWYLHTFFLCLVFLFITFKSKTINLALVSTGFAFLLLSIVLFLEFYLDNTFSHDTVLFNENINVLLKNSVNKIHPLLLYSSLYIFFAAVYRYFIIKQPKDLQFTTLATSSVYTLVKGSSSLIFIALYLGSWWALQEGSWGGWWNWDSSEFFGLLIFYFIVLFFHIPSFLKSNTILVSYCFRVILFLFLFFFMLQLNFSVISHNFGFRSVKFLSIEVILGIMWVCTLTVFWIKSKNLTLLLHKVFRIKQIKWRITDIFILLFSVFNSIILLTLISFFVKSLLNFKFFFNFLSFYKLLCIVVIFIWSKSLNVNLKYIFIFMQDSSVLSTSLIMLQNLYRSLSHFYLHYIIFIGFFFNLIGKYSTVNSCVFVSYQDLLCMSNYFSVNSREIELLLNFIIQSTSFEGKSFDLILHNNYIYQSYLINSTYWSLVVNSIDNTSFRLNILTIIFALLSFSYFLRREQMVR